MSLESYYNVYWRNAFEIACKMCAIMWRVCILVADGAVYELMDEIDGKNDEDV